MSDGDPRLDRIVEVLMAYARRDFAPRLDVSDRLDDIDAIATGINLLAEELDGEVASRHDFEAALESLRATQAQLVMAEKLAAVGQLASGVAHELNNPSTWVLLGLELAQRRLNTARALASMPDLTSALDNVDEALADMRAGLERMRSVISDLGALSRNDPDRMGLVNLDELVHAACQLARPSYHSVARLVLDLHDVPPVVGDRARLGQVITNLVVNAAHALGERDVDSSEITVRTRVDGLEAVLIVEDNGAGIPEALRERVFEPYFTTKPADVGTGLGLALVRRIAERHGGSTCATSSAAGGARIEVRVPLASTEQRATMPAPPDPSARARSGSQPPTTEGGAVPEQRRPRVLLIDDEPLLLKILRESVDEETDVVTALGGDAALELLATDRNFDLVICDLQMPKTDGPAVYSALQALAPDLIPRVVVMSGGAVTPRARQFLERVHPRILAKPLSVDEALAMIRDAVKRRRQ